MKTNILKPIRWWTLVLCCVLLTAARAQDVETPAAGKDATVQAAAQDDKQSDHDAPRDDEAARTEPSRNEGDEWTGSNRHRHRHNDSDEDAVVAIGHKAELLAGQHAESVVGSFLGRQPVQGMSTTLLCPFSGPHT